MNNQESHKKRMQASKEKMDAKVAQANQDKGLLVVITGNGKGKSTSGFGTVARAIGYGFTAKVVQYVKGTWPCGERDLLEKLGVEFHVMGTGFTWETQDKQKDIQAAEKAWEASKAWLQNPDVDVVLLDELTYMLSYKYLDIEEVISYLDKRPPNQHVIITGRACHRSIINMADTVSEVKSIKHAFESGVKAQKGIDW